jgi:hypothetical protein
MAVSPRILQRCVLIAGATLIVLIGLFPPYLSVAPAVELNGKKYPEKVTPIGYYSIFDPPGAFDPDTVLTAEVPVEPKSQKTGLTTEDGLRQLYPLRTPVGPQRLMLARIDVMRLAVQWITVMLAVAFLAYAFRPD